MLPAAVGVPVAAGPIPKPPPRAADMCLLRPPPNSCHPGAKAAVEGREPTFVDSEWPGIAPAHGGGACWLIMLACASAPCMCSCWRLQRLLSCHFT